MLLFLDTRFQSAEHQNIMAYEREEGILDYFFGPDAPPLPRVVKLPVDIEKCPDCTERSPGVNEYTKIWGHLCDGT